jgi:hypothetical protein
VNSKPVSAASRWNSIDWQTVQKRINKLQSRITKATAKEQKEENMKLPPMEHLVNELLERSAVKVARSVLRGG